MPVAAVAAGTIGVGLISANKAAKAQKNAANQAAQAQTESSQAAIDEQKRQFDAIQELMKPYVNAGTGALAGQQDLLGLNGAAKQQAAIDSINNSQAMQTYMQQGENAILQNASATGGLRGGNTQSALSQFRPQLLNQLINQQYQNLGGLTSIGQNAAAGVGNAGMQSANTIGNLLQQSGAAQAGNALAQGQASASQWAGIGNLVGQLGGAFIGRKF
ncbi:hypothetical protein PS357_08105 [Acinetobacter nosocomialis]|uniref:hypothetical protein n=1 Tax=Acinetobacter calcoaceticus/baumannii complex TaxID=909768 RepID=UPI00070770C9|nr:MULTISPECIES: hypothetical protein [Acinetobacter calcoaceticus/baumannii complex]KQE41347.1 hypothetical protein APD45_11960 [Acinetobacter baumannii]KQE48215.1 hypothetical protein APD45_05615 [Acinetobacter baumannii]MDC9815708.1 hypothetical protein [Acinetobacter nosocomialis]MDE9404930.1 hypothetical protein [Acinetobacter nosocomialis]HDG9761584.1 hypothetical protein [Acinetobacter nosocomialis]